MTDKPIIQADFVKPNLVPSRKVLQLIFEVPEEAADHAMAVLGGIPQSGHNQWCAIARLADEPAAEPTQTQSVTETEDDAPERLKGGARAKRAGILCNNPEFQRYMKAIGPPEKCFPPDPPSGHMTPEAANARVLLLQNCYIGSMTQLDHDESAGWTFGDLVRQFNRTQPGQTTADHETQLESGPR